MRLQPDVGSGRQRVPNKRFHPKAHSLRSRASAEARR